ncbi:pilus assembly protein PilM [Pontiellaceae bacterium B12219]|nr:pilus assembly protein PilM [Pontiellaceae bacterium B12219]
MKTERIIALDIGADGVRMAVLDRTASGVVHSADSGYCEYVSGLPAELPREAVVAMTLKQLLEGRSLNSRRVHLSVDGQSVFSRIVKLPMVGKDQLQKTIRHEAVQHIPFPIDEVVWDAHVFDENADEPDVLLVAVKADVIEGLVHSVTANGLSVEHISVAPVALANAVRSSEKTDEPLLVVDVGRAGSNLVFLDGNRIFFRTLPVGGNQLDRLVQEIERSITFYKGQQQGNPPRRISVCGGAEAVELLQAHLSVPVVPSLIEPGSAVCMGLAVAQSVSIDLIPESLQRQRDLQKRQPVWLACMTVLMVIGAVWIYNLNVRTKAAEHSAGAAAENVEALRTVERQMLPLEDQIALLVRTSDVYATALKQRTFWLETLSEISRLLPDGMFLLASEPIHSMEQLTGVRISVVSYLDKEAEGQDVVKQLRDTLRNSHRFDEKTRVFSRPSKKKFAREFVLDVSFAEGAEW